MLHICLLSTPVDLFERWLGLLAERPVSNGGVFDLLHIKIMLFHDVTTIYTFNIKDFSWCSQIEAIAPSHR